MTEQVQELEKYRVGARALAARIIGAQEAERVRISRELHDETGQALTLLLVRLQLVENMSSEARVQRELAELRTLVAGTLDGVRDLAVRLGPSILEDLGLCSALEWLVARVREETGLTVEVHLDSSCDSLGQAISVAVFRIAQEALTNIVRHANATRVTLGLAIEDKTLKLSVADNGRGFDVGVAQAHPTASVGLFGMAERIALAGGGLDITSRPGLGTLVTATVPIEDEVLA